jgi:methionyl-tRNA formyltransferase
MTYAPMMKKEEGQLDFSLPASKLERKVRAFNPWPGTYFEWDGNLLKVHRASIRPGKKRERERLIIDGLPAVGTSDGVLVLEEVQPAGKKSMPGKAFLAGAREWTGG